MDSPAKLTPGDLKSYLRDVLENPHHSSSLFKTGLVLLAYGMFDVRTPQEVSEVTGLSVRRNIIQKALRRIQTTLTDADGNLEVEWLGHHPDAATTNVSFVLDLGILENKFQRRLENGHFVYSIAGGSQDSSV